jgi:acetyl-CoA acetyltransferase
VRDAVIVEAVRTPGGKGRPGGRLHGEHPAALLAGVLKELVARAGIDPALVDDVIGGCVTQAGDDPLLMLTAIMPATEKVLARSGLRLADIDLFEVNEAFASVVLAWQRELGVDADRLNVRGGAIAVGHPLGGSGARIMTTLLHALEDRDARFGLQTMCEAGGMANATIIERL